MKKRRGISVPLNTLAGLLWSAFIFFTLGTMIACSTEAYDNNLAGGADAGTSVGTGPDDAGTSVGTGSDNIGPINTTPTSSTTQDVWPDEQWQTAQPSEVGLRGVQAALDKMQNTMGSSCGVIVKNGKLVGQFGQNYVGPAYSTGKTMLSAAVGIAVTKGLIKLTDDGFGPKGTKVRHNLTQVLPGGAWNYDPINGQTRIAQILGKGNMSDGLAFAQRKLFKKIKMKNPIVGSFFKSSCSDLARFGWLMSSKGKWGTEQLISRDYWDKAVKPVPGNAAYGFLFWLNHKGPWSSSTSLFQKRDPKQPVPGDPTDMVYAKGLGGQIILAFPSQKLVISRMGPVTNVESMPKVYELWDAIRPVFNSISKRSKPTQAPPVARPKIGTATPSGPTGVGRDST